MTFAAALAFTGFVSDKVAFAAPDEVSPAALVGARELFREATEDVDAGRFAVALEKFKRVAAVKETPAVRFNIGRCEEALGRTGTALADFELAERQARADAAKGGTNDEIARLAREHADALRPKVARLTILRQEGAAPEGLTVTVDGAHLTGAALGVPLPVDPGAHTIDATAPGHAPFHTDATLAAGEAKSIKIALPVVAGAEPPGGGGQPEHPEAAVNRTPGYILAGAGVALGAGALVFLVMHNAKVSDLNDACPGGTCRNVPVKDQDALRSKADAAALDQTLAIGLGAASLVALGTGAYFLFRSPSSSSSPSAFLAPGAPRASLGASLHVTF